MPTIPLTSESIAATLIIILVAGVFLSCTLAWLTARKPDDNGLIYYDGRKIHRQ